MPKRTKPPILPVPPGPGPVLERLVEFYHGCLLDSTEGQALLSQNGLWDPGLIERFQLGYCDGSLTDILSPQDPAREPLLKEGLLIPNGRTVREALLGMITAPLCDPDGGVSGLAGWNPSHTAMIVTKGHPIWNLPVCYRVAHILITQTLLDGLCLVRSGLDNVIAILSTPDTNMNMNRALLQAGAHSIHIIGTKPPSRKWLEALALPEMLFLSLPQSPHEILRQTNPLTLLEQVSQARRVPLDSDSGLSGIDLLDGGFAATFGSRRYEIRGLFKRDHQLKATLRTEHNGHLHIDTVDLYSARSRKALARDLRRLFVQEAQLIDADIDRLVRLCEEVHPSQLSLTSPGSLPASPILTLKEREEAERFGTDPDLINRILADFDACGLIGESANKLLGYLAMTSRKLPHPLSVLTLSSSGAGKSTLQDSILAFCPPEDLVRLTSLSSRALFYKAPFSLKHKVLALEEALGGYEATYALRSLISSGFLTIETTIKEGSGRLGTVQNRVEGPTSVFLTTTNPDLDPETLSRFFVTGVDESKSQTLAILSAQRHHLTPQAILSDAHRSSIIRTHHLFQRRLQALPVLIPQAIDIDYQDDRLQSRRDQPKLLGLIQAVALLRQMTKTIQTLTPPGRTPLDYIEADQTDIDTARRLTRQILGPSGEELNRVSRDLFEQILQMVDSFLQNDHNPATKRTEVLFTRRDIRIFTGWGQARVHRYLQQLVDLEYLLIESSQGRRLIYRILHDNPVLESLTHDSTKRNVSPCSTCISPKFQQQKSHKKGITNEPDKYVSKIHPKGISPENRPT